MLVRSLILSRRGGFTLIEMMITIAVLAILMTLALPGMGKWMRNGQIRTAAESLQNGLQQARNEAARRNVAVEFVLGPGSGWTIQLANVGTVLESRSDGSDQVVYVSAPANATTVTFDGMGRRMTANAAGGGPVLTQICVDLPPAVLPAADTRDLELDVSMSGSVRMCDPKVPSPTDTRVCELYPTPCTFL